MKLLLAVLIVAAMSSEVFGHRLLNAGKKGKFDGFDFEATNAASSDAFATSGQTMAMGKGQTRISSSIGHKGTINNIKSTQGGKAASSFKQVSDSKASHQAVKKDKNGNAKLVESASHDANKVQGANQQAFLGKGAASNGISKDGIVSDVFGSKGAADASSWNGVKNAKASKKVVNKKGHKKAHKKANKKAHKKAAKKHVKKHPKKHLKKHPKKHIKKAKKHVKKGKKVGAAQGE